MIHITTTSYTYKERIYTYKERKNTYKERIYTYKERIVLSRITRMNDFQSIKLSNTQGVEISMKHDKQHVHHRDTSTPPLPHTYSVHPHLPPSTIFSIAYDV